MKRLITLFAFVLCLALLLCACAPAAEQKETTPTTTAAPTTQAPEETTVPPTEPIPQETENSAYAAYATSLAPLTLGVLRNEPFDGEAPVVTETWMEDVYECGYIIPRLVGTIVELYAIDYGEDGMDVGTIADEPLYQTVAEDGCVVYSALPRPEGMPLYYLKLTAPDGSTYGMELSFNGRTGTPPTEYLCGAMDEAAADAILQEQLDSAEYSWGLEEGNSNVEGIPYANFRVSRMVTDESGAHESYVCNALVAPDGSVFAAELDYETDLWHINSTLAELLS